MTHYHSLAVHPPRFGVCLLTLSFSQRAYLTTVTVPMISVVAAKNSATRKQAPRSRIVQSVMSDLPTGARTFPELGMTPRSWQYFDPGPEWDQFIKHLTSLAACHNKLSSIVALITEQAGSAYREELLIGSKARLMRNNPTRQWAVRRNSGYNPHGKFYESNGPDVKIRGTAANIAEKYQQLARDAHTSGDLVAAEGYQQYAEHY